MQTRGGNGALRPDALRRKLISLAQLFPTKSAWLEQLDRLGEKASPQERVAAFQEVRAAAVVPPEAGFYLVAWVIDLVAEERIRASMADGTLSAVDRQMVAIELAHGLEEDEAWGPDEGPEEYETLRREWDRIADDLKAATFREFGEEDMADLFLNAPAEFDRLFEEGRCFFHGEMPD